MPPHEEDIVEQNLPDAWLFLGSVKLHLANHQPMTWGDELAWIICDCKQEVVGHD